MALISTRLHGALDYASGASSLATARLLRDRRAGALLATTGAGTLVTSAMTDYELGLRRKVPMPMHLAADAATGGVLLAGALVLRRLGAKVFDWVPLAAVGLIELAAAALTERQPGDRHEETLPGAVTGVTGEGMAARTSADTGLRLATPPLETPGPSVTPPASPESDVERAERVDEWRPSAEAPPTGDTLVAQEESAAAAEAAAIGGNVPTDSEDPAMDPVYQAGGGDQDGWEEAEAALIENATHGDGGGDPQRDAFAPELESDRSGAVYGESDGIAPEEPRGSERRARDRG